MKLTELNPQFVGAANGRKGVGLMADCPCGGCGEKMYVAFSNPLDGGTPCVNAGEPTWQRSGTDFYTLTLRPSVHRVRGCGWHGFIENGEIRSC